MSWEAVAAVLDHSRARLADRLVLIVIAESAGRDGTGCRRGKPSIAQRAGIDVRTVQRCLRSLEALGELQTTARPGRPSEYVVTLPGLLRSIEGRQRGRRVASP